MIAEKAADMIKGRQLDPYEPEHGEQGESVVAPTRLRAPLVRGAHSRSMASVAAPPAPAHNLSETAQHQHLHLNLNHNHHHHQFIHNKYASSAMADSIMRKML